MKSPDREIGTDGPKNHASALNRLEISAASIAVSRRSQWVAVGRALPPHPQGGIGDLLQIISFDLRVHRGSLHQQPGVVGTRQIVDNQPAERPSDGRAEERKKSTISPMERPVAEIPSFTILPTPS